MFSSKSNLSFILFFSPRDFTVMDIETLSNMRSLDHKKCDHFNNAGFVNKTDHTICDKMIDHDH
ncbi:hypothetical protein BpHYR1_051317 [Brachionus plicatilis]|uniref:Uncharacterized protein n=1 Tax=Brachionus plicatilis TaxID=10195 RepID=A0A3M7QN48_BRAPC|nr:hypothetical protein BpHYR1_051317 [Brachionus plicatilis]